MKTCKYCNSEDLTQYSTYSFYDVFECNSCKLWSWKSIPECCRNPRERIVAQNIDFNICQIRIQCDNCGGCLNMRKPLNHERYSIKVSGEFSMERHNNWKQSKAAERDYIYATSEAIKFQNSKYAKYLNHLQSPYWKNIRQQVLLRDNNTCQSCKNVNAQEVHHITYVNLGKEKLEDLVSYCRKCHRFIHN